MKIEESQLSKTNFASLCEGDICTYNRIYYMKIYADRSSDVYRNAVDLENHKLAFIEPQALVELKEAKLVIL